ncbi:MAG: hypothetical protein WAJ93_18510, partial [Candidatus Nitrosopolaris sp.]
KCQACWYMILSTMSGSTTDNGKISDVFVIIGLKSMLSCLVGARLILIVHSRVIRKSARV